MKNLFDAANKVHSMKRRLAVGLLKLHYAVILTILIAVAVTVGKFVFSNESASSENTSNRPASANTSKEVDFGLVELDPETPMPIISYKKGGNLILFAGDELRFQISGEAPLPEIELRAGSDPQALPGGAEGTLIVVGPSGQALLASMSAKGNRVSLPGGAPPRVSVKVQVFSTVRSSK